MPFFRTLAFATVILLPVGCTSIQTNLLFFPSHHPSDKGLSHWKSNDGKIIGYSRPTKQPENVWLMLPGNAGQAADRAYALSSFSERDSVYILEYPGYGTREGTPSKASIDEAAIEAFHLLQQTFSDQSVCVVGESIGTGPACSLAAQSSPPEKIVLITPFDKLTSVAARMVGAPLANVLLEAKWDNIQSLAQYEGLVEIFAAERDRVIPVDHAKNLARSHPGAQLRIIPGGHNDWSTDERVKIRNP